MEKKLQQLKTRLAEVDDINSVVALLNWDQSTYMPPGGAAARGRQMATLSHLGHQKFTDPTIGRLLDDLQPYAETLPYESDEAALVRVTRHDYEQAIKVPPQLLAEFNAHATATFQAWTVARPNNDFEGLRPLLQRSVDFSRQIANCFPGYAHIADPLIDFSDEGMKAESIRVLFNELRQHLVPLVKAVSAKTPTDDSCLRQHYPEKPQLEFGRSIIEAYGYDFDRGRQDKTHHPFMTKFSLGDVRITTRTNENNLNEAIFSTLHEAGHALYEQGINRTFEGSPLANGTSAGIHESQSRLWENQVGRSLPFWRRYYPQLQAVFPNQLQEVSLENFYRAINKVQHSLIRTDADELTYNLHVMIRFDLELALLEGSLEVKELPQAWHERYETDLGVRAPNDINGVLQDVHWFGGFVGGAFQGYTLGNIMSALFFEQALQTHPTIPEEIAAGNFSTLHNWLKKNIYQYGRKFTADELIQQVSGKPLTIYPYMRYLHQKFGELYTLN